MTGKCLFRFFFLVLFISRSDDYSFLSQWCFVGKRRLEKAIRTFSAARPNVSFHVRYLPFFLDKNLPIEGKDKLEHYNAKFGAARVRQIIPHMQRVGALEDPPIRFSYGGTIGNTIDSHRLIERAMDIGGEAMQDRLVEALFSAYFENEKNPASCDVLAAAAAAAGMGRESEVRTFLKSGQGRDDVLQKSEQLKRKYGITGVPHFIIGAQEEEMFMFSGAQDSDMLVEMFEQVESRKEESSKM